MSKIYILLWTSFISITNKSIKNFLNKIKVDKNNNAIKITSNSKDLMIFNGMDELYYENHEKNVQKIITIKDFSSCNLLKIISNDSYIGLLFNDSQGKIVIIDKLDFSVKYNTIDDIITNGVWLMNNQLVVTNINNGISCYKTNGEIIWHHNQTYSKLIYNGNQNLIFDKYIYWVFNNNLIYIVDPIRGTIEEDISLGDKIIINVTIGSNNLIIITNKSIEIYDKNTISLKKTINNIYPLSSGIINNNQLYCHDNKNLLICNLNDYTMETIPLKHESVSIRLLDPLILYDMVIMATIAGKWYIVYNKKVHVIDQWKLWSNVLPAVYYNNIYFYQNFSTECFNIISKEDILKLIKN